MKVKSRETSNQVEAFNILSEEDEEKLNHVQKKNLEFFRNNIKIKDMESFEELKEELEEIESLKERHIIKILEILPTHEKEVKTLLSKERIKLEDSEVERITDICSSYEG